MNGNGRSRHHSRVALILGAATFLTAAVAEAQITRIVIDPARSESPTFEGRLFGTNGSVGPDEKLRGNAYGELDPADPRNAVITDIQFAPRNARGKVEYSMDIFILKPIDLQKGNHKVILDFNNRGEMRLGALNDAALEQQPHDGRTRRQRLRHEPRLFVVGNGWDFGAAQRGRRDDNLCSRCEEPDGSSITGPSYRYINFDDAKSVRY